MRMAASNKTTGTEASLRAALSTVIALGLLLGLAGANSADPVSAAPVPTPPASDRKLPTLFLIGDSTVKNGTRGQVGWGDPLAAYFDPAKIKVVNRARGGRSSRTYQTEGLWDQVLAEMKPGDFVLLQFGHNDGGPIAEGRARASLKGAGDESQEIVVAATGKKEVVRTYGWYLRKYIADAKARGATPLVLSPVPRNIWKDDRTVARASGDYGKWAAEAAGAGGAAFVDLNEIVARRYEQIGQEKVKQLFEGDHTHTNAAGAEMNAAAVIAGLKGIKDSPLRGYLSAKAGAVGAADGGRGEMTGVRPCSAAVRAGRVNNRVPNPGMVRLKGGAFRPYLTGRLLRIGRIYPLRFL